MSLLSIQPMHQSAIFPPQPPVAETAGAIAFNASETAGSVAFSGGSLSGGSSGGGCSFNAIA